MSNPWLDPQRAKHWSPQDKPGNVLREQQIDVLLALARAQEPACLLDLGCGPGWIARRVLEEHKAARVICLDASMVMLDRARKTLADHADRVRFVCATAEDDWIPALGERPDFVLASHAIHHVDADEKRKLFERVHAVLPAGGTFALSDRVAFDGRLFPHMVSLWNVTRASGGFDPVDDALDYAAWRATERAGGDVPDTVEDQLAWLRAAGFDPVDCFWRNANLAVLAAIK